MFQEMYFVTLSLSCMCAKTCDVC